MSNSGGTRFAGGLREWRVRPAIPGPVREALQGVPDLLAQLLYNRGIATRHAAVEFLNGAAVSHDPYLLPDMEAASARLVRAVQRRERVAVFGDFDVDGISATALLATALRPLGCEVVPYIPHRVDEGHGLSMRAVEYMAELGVGLLITVDCGISSHEEIEAARRAGIETIVTDHHLPPAQMPRAYAVVDPRLPGSGYPFDGLTGAGLALKLAQALYGVMGFTDPAVEGELLALATLGTIADVAPLLDENRSIVREGLRYLNQHPSIGMRALLQAARLDRRPLTADSVGWVIGPRLNAAGRMDEAEPSYRLLVAQSPSEAANLAEALEVQNRQRQQITVVSYERARELITPAQEQEPLVLVGDPSFSPGIIGLVAGRLADELARPAVVVSIDDGFSRGSGRSVPWFNLGQALYTVAGAVGGFQRHGGHAQAAGFTIGTGQLAVLREALVREAAIALANAYGTGDVLPRPSLEVDAEVPLRKLPKDVHPLLQKMAPFGPGNPEPLFLSRGVVILDARRLGGDGQHLRLKLLDGNTTWDAIAFRQGERSSSLGRRLDVVYAVEVDRWNGLDTLRLRVVDFAIR